MNTFITATPRNTNTFPLSTTMATYQQDMSSAYPSRETFGILEGKPAMFKGQGPCDHRNQSLGQEQQPSPLCSAQDSHPCHPQRGMEKP
jgi:hypothetical protein